MRRLALLLLLQLCLPLAWAATVNITYLGDSLSYGAGLASPSTQSYPRLVQNLAVADGLDWASKNAGVSGNTSAQGLARLPALLALKPNWLFVELGGNDGLRGYTLSGMKANLVSIIQSAQAAGVPVILAGMQVPVTFQGLNTSTTYTAAFAAVFPEVARQLNVPLMPFLAESVGDNPALMQSDGIHPNAAGHVAMARHVYDFIRPTVTGNGRPVITITTGGNATEAGAVPGSFTIRRSGSTATSWSVFFDLSGVAGRGSDYTTSVYDLYGKSIIGPGVDYSTGKGYAFIPTGSATATVIITPVPDTIAETNETVILTAAANAGYVPGSPVAATLVISEKPAGTTTAPAITSQPGSTTVTVGATATFTVVASGTPAPTYQWQKNGANISGATAASYTTPATVSGDNGASFRCLATNSAGSATSQAATLTVSALPALPAGWSSADIGTTNPAGSAVGDGDSFTIAGSGADIWNAADSFRYTWLSVTGDHDVVVKVVSQTNTNAWAKAGLMIRESTAAGSRHVFALVSPLKGTAMQYRSATKGSSGNIAGQLLAAPIWLKLSRRGTTFSSYQSTDGTTWKLMGTRTLAIPSTALVGLAVTSHATGKLSTAMFTDFSLLPVAAN